MFKMVLAGLLALGLSGSAFAAPDPALEPARIKPTKPLSNSCGMSGGKTVRVRGQPRCVVQIPGDRTKPPSSPAPCVGCPRRNWAS